MNAVSKELESKLKSTDNIAEKATKKSASRIVAGNIEQLFENRLTGWVVDSDCKKDGITFYLYEGNTVIATSVANIRRKDLKEAGYKKGGFGFDISVPQRLIDNSEHTLCLRIEGLDRVVCRRTLVASVFAIAEIEDIEAGMISGHLVVYTKNEKNSYELEVLVDNNILTTGSCTKCPDSQKYQFSIELPTDIYDDSLHQFEVRIAKKRTTCLPKIARLASIQTPWKYINDGAVTHRLSGMPPAAVYRYIALQHHIAKIDYENNSVNWLKNIRQAHAVAVEGYESRQVYPKLSLPAESSPEVSIVVPVFNNMHLTYHCLASLILAHNQASFEVILVDDYSTDDTASLATTIENLVYVPNEKNEGFLRSSNYGASLARGDYIVFLNNDTEVTSGWIDSLKEVFSTFSDVGAVGSKLIYPNGRLQEAGGIVWGNGKPWNIGNGQNPEHPMYNYTREVDYLSGASLMVSKDVWNEVGGFSEELAPAYYEDTDLSFKVREAGYRTVYTPFSTVIHFEGMSNGRDTNAGVKRFQGTNAPKFRAKWRHAYRNNGTEGKNLAREMDRNVDFRALVIDYSTPRLDVDAGSYAAIQEMALLQELGCKITFLPNNIAYMGRHTEMLQKRGIECVHAPFYSSSAEFLKSRGDEFDLVYVTRYDVAEQLIPSIKKYSKAKIVFNNADLHFLRELRAAAVDNNKKIEKAVETRERELKVMREVDGVLSYNEIEHSVIASHNLTSENVFKCPWVLKSKRSQVAFEKREGIAFLGGFRHLPNIEAVEYCVEHIMPALRKAGSDIKFHVYGSHMPEEVIQLAGDDVVIEGYVENLSEIFDSCRVFIAPLVSGAGIKGKVLDSISYGVPSVLSPIAAEATGLTHGHSTYIAETAEEWRDSIIELYCNEEQWIRTAEHAHSLVKTEYSFNKGIERMRKVMNYIELEPAENGNRLFV